MSDRVGRFKKRKNLMKDVKSKNGLHLKANSELVNHFLNTSSDSPILAEVFDNLDKEFNIDRIDVFAEEIESLLDDIMSAYNKDKFDKVFSDCKRSILQSIAGPFGLGGVVGALDENGGNVDTVNNVRKGIYATNKEKQKFNNKEDYNSSEYHKHENYIDNNRSTSKKKKGGTLKDSYTGKEVARNADIDLDHTIAAENIHNDQGRVLADLDGPDLANVDSNLNPTDRSLNRSMGAKSIEEYNQWLAEKEPERQCRIAELEKKQSLSAKEANELDKLNKQENDYNPELAKGIDKKARKEYNSKINKAYYTSGKFIKNTTKTSATEGAKMGLQQAMGALLTEFFLAVFDEVMELHKEGMAENSFVEELKARVKSIVHRIASKWIDAVDAFKDGFISGFLSNIATTIINIFVTTSKRVVRMIREGFFSLLKAIKLLLFPPENMSLAEAAHEATKLLAGGLMVIGGVAFEEYIDAQLKLIPPLEFFSDIITGVLVGSLTAISTVFVVYLIDQADIFKVNDKERHKYIMNKLEESIDLGIDNYVIKFS